MRMVLVFILNILTISAIHAKEIELTNDNSVSLNSAVSAQSVSKVISEIKRLDAQLKSGYPIYLFLNTPGGSIQAGLELIEFLKGVNRPVHTVTLFAASMGFQIVQHAGTRYITEYGVLMSHKASGGFQGEFGGNSSQLDSRYTMWLRRLNMMDSKTVQRTKGKKTLKQYQAEYDNELWLNGSEAIKNGYADEVVSVKCSANLQGDKTEVVSFMGVRIEVKFDKCPLVTSPVSIKPLVRTNKGMMDLDTFVNLSGSFEEDCKKTSQKATQDWSGQIVAPAQDAELCALDKSLSLEKMENIVEKYKNEKLTNNKQVLKMSFSALISE